MLQFRKNLSANLSELLARKRSEVMEMKTRTRESDLEQRMYPTDRRLVEALRPGGTRAARPLLIASIRARTPWGSQQSVDGSVEDVARMYEARAAALLYEADEKLFGGYRDTTVNVREATSRPVIADDYVISDYQIFWLRTQLADSVVLHASLLPGDAIDELLQTARPLLMEPVVAVSNEAELKETLGTSAKIIAITNRDPETHKVDLQTFHRLAPMVDGSRIVIAAGGYESKAEIDRLAGLADAVMIGGAAARAAELGF
jgi:indole-3-glycerol phosphate synthase